MSTSDRGKIIYRPTFFHLFKQYILLGFIDFNNRIIYKFRDLISFILKQQFLNLVIISYCRITFKLTQSSATNITACHIGQRTGFYPIFFNSVALFLR